MGRLDRWRFLIEPTPHEIEMPKMELMSGHDHMPPLLIGVGKVELRTPASFHYTISGTPDNEGYVYQQLHRWRENPYDGLSRFRLIGTDRRGIDWLCGWVTPAMLEHKDSHWTFSGRFQGLMTDDRDTTDAPPSSVENIFIAPLELPFGRAMARFVRSNSGNNEESPTREYTLDVLNTKVHFSYDRERELLTVRAATSELLPHPYAENWISEPFRILFGQLIYPRVVARNFTNRIGMISLRSSPGFIEDANYSPMLDNEATDCSLQSFWDLYAKILTLVATERDETGQLNFESHTITHLYEEVVQSARGSRWVGALILASTIEALLKILIPPKDRKTRQDVDREAITSLLRHINSWPNSDEIRNIATRALSRALEMTPISILREMVSRGIVTSAQFDSWRRVRNRVMHGELVSPWSTQEEDRRIMDLAELMHRLTTEIVTKAV